MTVEPLRKILPYTAVLIGIFAVYVGIQFYSRHDAEQRAQAEAAAKEAESKRDTVNRVGGGSLNITGFYASPPVIRRGEKTKLCYGVAFAKSVAIEPEIEHVWPALSHCADAKPAKTTTYTLTARDEGGHVAKKTAEIVVQ